MRICIAYIRHALCLLFLALLFSLPASAQERHLTPQQQAIVEALQAAGKVATKGPATVNLLNEGTLDLPAGYVFIPQKEAIDFMRALGNAPGPDFIGLIVSPNDKLRWLIEVDFAKAGHVNDNDAKNWKADEMLSNIKKNTEAGNKERAAKGFQALDVLGWVQPPTYDAGTHQLVWSVLAQNRGAAESTQVVNYNTFALGRDGFFKLVLIAPNATIDQDKQHAYAMLSALHYDQGKTYADFNSGTDKEAEFGLDALVAGIAAKKLGVIGIIVAFLIKGLKLVIFLCLVFIKKIKNFFTRFRR